MKPLAHAVLIAGTLNVLSLVPLPPGIALAQHLISPWAYTIVAASTAAALHERKAMVIVIVAIVTIASYPIELQSYARLMAPQGIGILVGKLLRTLFLEEHYDSAATAR